MLRDDFESFDRYLNICQIPLERYDSGLADGPFKTLFA
jgi:hypothetical protein